MKGKLGQKAGPLKLWQWLLLGGGLGVGVYLYRRSHPAKEGEAQATLEGSTGTGAFGPVDPNTGIPYSFESGGGGGATSTPGGLEGIAGLVSIIGTLKELGIIPETGTPTQVAPQSPEPTPGAGARRKHERKAAHKKNPATSTGAGASPKDNTHTAAPHPATRIGIGSGKPLPAVHPRAGVGSAHPTTPAALPAPFIGANGGIAQIGGAGGASNGQTHANAYSSGLGANHPKPNAPAGYHAYKGANGQWWFAPN